MTTKKSWILVSIFAAILLACCIALSACGNNAVTYALTWSVEEHATVTVEGYSELPDSYEENASIVFTVTCDTGYEVNTVKANTTTLTASDDGKYTRTISADTTFTITVKKVISSVEVTTKPTKLTYYSGESLDTTGMVVTVNYASGGSEVVTSYSVSPATFTIGDTSFTVTYSKVTSEAVSLDSTVTALITMDAAGGTIDSDYLTTLSSRTDISNYSVDSDGVISFEHSGLSSAITLPTSAEVTRDGQFSFNSWVYGDDNTAITEIAASDADSYSLTLAWDAVLITVNSIKLEYTTYNGVEAPYLIINFTFEEVESAYLYLYEGNADAEFVGDTVTIGDSNTVDLYFNLSKLGEYGSGSLAGKWMDLRFNAIIDGREYSQTFQLDHDNPIAEVGGSVQDDTYSYTILTYRSNGNDDIKIAFNAYTTTVSFSVDSDTSTLTISGTANLNNIADGSTVTGATVSIEMGGAEYTGTLDETTGAWTIAVDLTKVGTTGVAATNFANFKVVTADNTTILLSANKINYTWLTDTYEYSEVFGNPSWYVNSWSYGSGKRLYIGTMDSSSWTDAFYAVVDEGLTYDSVTLVADSTDGRPMLVVSGTYDSAVYTADEAKAAIESAFYLDLQSYTGNWAYRYYSTTENSWTVTVNNDGTFTVTVDITMTGDSGSTIVIGDVLYGHFVDESSNMSLTYVEATVSYNGVIYKISGYDSTKCDSWMNGLAIIYVYDNILNFSNVTLSADENGAPTLVITGTYEGYEGADDIKADFYLDLQSYSNGYVYRYYSSAENSCTVTVGNDGTFTITLAITVTGDSGSAMAAGDVLYAHIGTSSATNNMSVSYTANSVTYNGLTYTIGACTDELASEASWLSSLTIIYVTAAN